MTILITGAAGFIGYHLANKLLENNKDVVGLDNFNNYYDVKLKKARYKNLIDKANNQNCNFEMLEEDICNESSIKKYLCKIQNQKSRKFSCSSWC